MLNLLLIYFANLLGDYPLQGNFLATEKGKSNYILFVHSMIWTMCIVVVLLYLGLFAWWKLIMLLSGHCLMDWIKCHVLISKTKFALYTDQLFHIVQCAICL